MSVSSEVISMPDSTGYRLVASPHLVEVGVALGSAQTT
jgi:hypothetical protein